jgi:hypothetical protein
MQVTPIDEVTHYLQIQGMKPEPAYFGASGFQIGWRICVNDLDLVYRFADGSLIVCDLSAQEGNDASSDAVATFVHMVHRLERAGIPLREVRGMLFETLSNPRLNRIRHRLAAVLEAQGAYWRDIDGDPWLIYPVAATLHKS